MDLNIASLTRITTGDIRIEQTVYDEWADKAVVPSTSLIGTLECKDGRFIDYELTFSIVGVLGKNLYEGRILDTGELAMFNRADDGSLESVNFRILLGRYGALRASDGTQIYEIPPSGKDATPKAAEDWYIPGMIRAAQEVINALIENPSNIYLIIKNSFGAEWEKQFPGGTVFVD